MQISINGSTLFYHKRGNGIRHLLLFHGFGQDSSAFESLSQSIATAYTCYIFDLYYHGKSTWKETDKPLSKEHWKKIIDAFLVEHNLKTISLLGYSMGGKFALATLESHPKQVEEIFLLAPDGIKTNFWYNLATYSIILRALFKSMISKPKRFENIVHTLNALGVVDKRLIHFAEYQMNSETKRRRVYYAWVVLRKLTFNLNRIAQIINENAIKATVIVGQYDAVIPPKAVEAFVNKLNNVSFEIIATGHSGLIQQSLQYVLRKNNSQRLKNNIRG